MNNDRYFQEKLNKYNNEIRQMRNKSRPSPQNNVQSGRMGAPVHTASANAPVRHTPEDCMDKPLSPTLPHKQEDCPCTRPAARRTDCAPFQACDHTQTVGDRGPALLQDTMLHETLETFVHQKMIERAVHTKGYGAFGHFKPYESMCAYTKACFLQSAGQATPVFVRFSFAVSNRGTPDTARNVRGFSTKFYTKEGVFDLLCNHIPVFFIRDAMRFPETIAALSPSPVNNLADPGMFWSYIARTPEATHALLWLYSDRGTRDSFRHMGGHSVNTYVWKNAEGRRRYVKYHWVPLAGERVLDRQQAYMLACENPDVAGQDLYDTLDSGKAVEYELNVQLMDPEDEIALPYDPLDDTKVWSETDYPLMPVGRLTLERNPDDYKSQVEKAAFSPANLTEGIELSADKMLQGRSFIYWDAQRRRLGPDFREMPVNREDGWSPKRLVTSGCGDHACGELVRADIPKQDDFTQAGMFYDSLCDTEKQHLIDNIASELHAVGPKVQSCVLGYLREASAELGELVAWQIELYSGRGSC